MNLSVLSDITFDDQDSNLFLVEDARLRADALKHSVLPRLSVVMNAAITRIWEIYGIEALDDSIVSVFPNFRQKRDNELLVKYDQVFVGLGGQRKAKWSGFSRRDGRPVQILPFRFAFILDERGVSIWLENGWLKGLDAASSEVLLHFHVENEDKINPLCFMARMRPDTFWSEELTLLSAFHQQYQCRLDHQFYDNHFFGHACHFPVAESVLAELVDNFACFFPVYDSYIQLAKGLPHRLDALIERLSDWLQRDTAPIEARRGLTTAHELNARAAEAAEKKVRVMPALRWQVFQRDHFKCCSCGRGSHDNVILHVDHIVPRSLGGIDAIENFQTLCSDCNIGKSNRSTGDLRNKS